VLKKLQKFCKTVQVLRPRCKLLAAYLYAINGRMTAMELKVKKAIDLCLKGENVMEESRLIHNHKRWVKGQEFTTNNTDWLEYVSAEDHNPDDFCTRNKRMVIFTLPLPSKVHRRW